MKPCPFCGAIVQNTDGLIKHEDDCYIMVHFYSAPRVDRDRKAWEMRPIETGLLDALKAIALYNYWNSGLDTLNEDINTIRDIALSAIDKAETGIYQSPPVGQ